MLRITATNNVMNEQALAKLNQVRHSLTGLWSFVVNLFPGIPL